jgi:hypothetical protein
MGEQQCNAGGPYASSLHLKAAGLDDTDPTPPTASLDTAATYQRNCGFSENRRSPAGHFR